MSGLQSRCNQDEVIYRKALYFKLENVVFIFQIYLALILSYNIRKFYTYAVTILKAM